MASSLKDQLDRKLNTVIEDAFSEKRDNHFESYLFSPPKDYWT